MMMTMMYSGNSEDDNDDTDYNADVVWVSRKSLRRECKL